VAILWAVVEVELSAIAAAAVMVAEGLLRVILQVGLSVAVGLMVVALSKGTPWVVTEWMLLAGTSGAVPGFQLLPQSRPFPASGLGQIVGLEFGLCSFMGRVNEC